MKYILVTLLALASFYSTVHAQSDTHYAVGGKMICSLEGTTDLRCATEPGFTRLRPPTNVPSLTTITAGDVHVCGLTQTGSVFCWGDNNFGQQDAPEDEQFISLSAGVNNTCGVTSDNRVLCWGLDTHSETEPPTDQLFSQAVSYTINSCGLTLEGKVTCWGQTDLSERLDDNNTFEKIAINSENVCGVTTDNNINCRFTNNVTRGTGYTDVAMSQFLICGLRSTGDISCSSNLISNNWSAHWNNRIAQINSGSDVVALYGSASPTTKMCVATADGGFECILRENSNDLALPSDGPIMLEAPINVSVDVFSESTVEILWQTTNSTGIPITGADIFRNDVLLVSTQNGRSYIDDTLVPGVDYTYTIELFTDSGERSKRSEPITVNSSQEPDSMDTNYTPVFRALSPANLNVVNYNSTEVELFWDRPTSLPANFNGYEIWRNHEFHAFTRGVSFYDNTVKPGLTYHYLVVPVSLDGSILGFSGIDAQLADN